MLRQGRTIDNNRMKLTAHSYAHQLALLELHLSGPTILAHRIITQSTVRRRVWGQRCQMKVLKI